MPSNFPTSLDNFTTGTLTGVVSGADHGNKADAINKLEARVIQEAPLNVRWPEFGAVGDGTVANEATALQAALDAATGVSKAGVFVPAGTYKTTAELSIPSGVCLFGEGHQTILKRTGTTAGKVLVNSDAVAGNAGITIRDLTVDRTEGNDALSTTLDNAINLVNVGRLTIMGVRARGAMKAIHLQSCQGRVTHCDVDSFRDNGIAINDVVGVGGTSVTDHRMVVALNDIKQTASTKAAAGSSPMIVTQSNTIVSENQIETTVDLAGAGVEIANPTTNAADIVVIGNQLRGCYVLVGHGNRHHILDNHLCDNAITTRSRIQVVPTGGSAVIDACSIRGNTINGALASPGGNIRVATNVTNTNISDCALYGGATLEVATNARPTTVIENVTGYSDTAFSAASAGTITPEPGADVMTVTGTTTVTSMTADARWRNRRVTLLFTGILTFTDGSNLKLNGNFVTSADDTITLVCDGTNWYEVARSVN